MDELVQKIQNNILQVQDNIKSAAQSANRDSSRVKLVVVTKLFPSQVVRAAIRAGATIIGENYPEECVEKKRVIEPEYPFVQWHMIGHCQSRKVKLVAENMEYIHSLDRLSFAKKLDQVLFGTRKRMPVLLEFNLSGEESKFGWRAFRKELWGECLAEIQEINMLQNLEIRGLMTMPPYAIDPESSRPYFVQLSRLRDYLSSKINGICLEELSMGTSIDYKVAVQEGATFVRIGEAILGVRLKTNKI